MAGGRALKRNAPLVKSVLTLLGAPAVLMHGLDVATEAVNRVGMPTEDLSEYADRAARELGEQQGHEFRELGEADKEAVEGIVARTMARLDRRAAVGAALRGNEHLVALLTDNVARSELAAIKAEGNARYHRVVIGRVCVLLQSWLRNSDELPRNTFEGLGEVLDEVVSFRAETRMEFRVLREMLESRQQPSDSGVVDVVERARSALGLSAPTISELNPYRVGVHRALEVADAPAGLTEFVDRASHDEVAAVLAPLRLPEAGPAMVTLVGGSCVGKTRALHHAILVALPDWSVFVPPDAPQLRTFLELGVPRGTVIWLDELQIYLGHEEHGRANAAYLIELLSSDRAPTFVVGATIWPEHLTALTHRDEEASKVSQLLLTEYATTIQVPTSLTDDALPGAIERAAHLDSRLAQAVDTSGEDDGIIQTLAGGVLLASRYDGRDGPAAPAFTPAARAVVTAAMELRRIGFGNPVPRWAVEGAAPAYLEARHYPAVTRDWVRSALREATETVRGVRALAPRASAPGVVDAYDLHDYLARLHLARNAHSPTTRLLWTTLSEHVQLEALDLSTRKRLVDAAKDRGLHTIATDLARTLWTESLLTGRRRTDLVSLLRLRIYHGDENAWDELWTMAVNGDEEADRALADLLADLAEDGGARALGGLAQLSAEGSTPARDHLIRVLLRRADEGDPDALDLVREVVGDPQGHPDPDNWVVNALVELANRGDEGAHQELVDLSRRGVRSAQSVLRHEYDDGRLHTYSAINRLDDAWRESRERALHAVEAGCEDEGLSRLAEDAAQVARGLGLAELARNGDPEALTQLRELVDQRYQAAINTAREAGAPDEVTGYILMGGPFGDPVVADYSQLVEGHAMEGDADALEEIRRLTTLTDTADSLGRVLSHLAKLGSEPALQELVVLADRDYEVAEWVPEILKELADAGSEPALDGLKLLAERGSPYARPVLDELLAEGADVQKLRTMVAHGSREGSWKLAEVLAASDDDSTGELVGMTHAALPGASSWLMDHHQRRNPSRTVLELDVDGGPVFGPTRG